jgi:hypothetical protein
MRKLFLLTIIVLATGAALIAFAADEAEVPAIPEDITIDGCMDTKAAVAFPHKAHFELAACVDCHHTAEGLTAENFADIEIATCGSCHNEPEEAETPKCSEKSSKKNPYHIKCITCHKAHKKEHADTTAPTKCTGCHPKPEKAEEAAE